MPAANKIILSAYINIGNLDEDEANQYLTKIKEHIKTKGIIYHIIPVRDQETKIECVYPNLVSDKKTKEKLNACLDDIINNIKKP